MGTPGHRGDPIAVDDLPEVLEQREVAVAKRSAQHDVLALEQWRQHGHHQRVGVEQRQRREDDAVLVEDVVCAHHPRVRYLVRVRSRGQLRGAGGAAGVQVARDLRRGRWGYRKRCVVCFRHPLGEVRNGGAVERLERGRLVRRCRGPQRKHRSGAGVRGDRARLCPHVGVELGSRRDDDVSAGAAHELGGVLGRQAGIDRGIDPDCLRGEQQRHHLGAVDRNDRYGLATPHPQLDQDGGRPVDVAPELSEGPHERRPEGLGVREHRQRRAVAPQAGRSPHELVGARGQPALAEGDALDRRQVRRPMKGRPQQLVLGRQRAHVSSTSDSGAR